VKFDTSTHRSESLLNCVHINILDPIKTKSLGEQRYFVSFVDDLSGYCWVYTMRQRFEVLDMLVKWKNMIEKQTGRKNKVLQIDNVGKYKD